MFSPQTKVLVVDDMMTMRKLVGKVCKELGFTDITEAADGCKGLGSRVYGESAFRINYFRLEYAERNWFGFAETHPNGF